MNILVIGKEGRLQQHSQKGRLDGHSLTYLPLDASPEVMIEKGRMAEVILIDAMGSLPGPVIECLPRLKLIHSEGVGYQGIDTETARRMGIYVCNCRGINAMAVAEHAVMLMVACLRDLAVNHQKVLEGLQIETKEGYMRTGSIREMSDCTVGLVGFGAIAREAARLLEVYGARCLFFDLSEVDKDLTHGAEQVDLDTLLSSSDIVSLHLPVTESTRNFADEAFFKKLKAGTIFINTARGELVDTRPSFPPSARVRWPWPVLTASPGNRSGPTIPSFRLIRLFFPGPSSRPTSPGSQAGPSDAATRSSGKTWPVSKRANAPTISSTASGSDLFL